MKFVEVLSEAASSEFHIGYRYSRMIRKLWLRYEQRAAGKSPTSESNRTDASAVPHHDPSPANGASRPSIGGVSPHTATPFFSRDPNVVNGSGTTANGNSTARNGTNGHEAPASYGGGGFPTPDLYDPDAALMNSHLFAPFAPELFAGPTMAPEDFGAMHPMSTDSGVSLGAGGLNYFDPWGVPVAATGANGSSWMG